MSVARRAISADGSPLRWRHNADFSVAEMDAAGAPDLLALAACDLGRYPFLLESSAGTTAQSRFDLLLAFPGDAVEVGAHDGDAFFAQLDRMAANERRGHDSHIPFIGGWFLYLGYEMAARVEPTLRLPRPATDVFPDALAVRCPAAIIHDRKRQSLQFVAENDGHDRITAMIEDFRLARVAVDPCPMPAEWQEAAPARYRQQVDIARGLIHAGDVFQVNLSRRWHGRLTNDEAPARLYAALRRANPAPFSGLLQWRGAALACSSPERLLQIDDGVAQTRPIAGTRARHHGREMELSRELLAHPKERAEHVMLIDLERNDLGRVCRSGSVAVDELMVTETYAHVHHIVSNVRGTLREDIGPGRALRAVFPGGTITGCPKVRCMQIIAELEEQGRGAYTGSFGYLSRCGRLDTNIIIRSLTQQERTLELSTGAGIVADSHTEKELEETRAKARGVLRSFVDRHGRPYG